MKKDILIIGAARSGKTSLMNAILDKYSFYEPLRGDAALTALSHVIPKKVRKEKDEYIYTLPVLTKEDTLNYLVTLYEEMKLDLSNTDRKIIIDTVDLSVEEAIDLFGKSCDIYCLGMPDEEVRGLEIKIRKTEKQTDWTYRMGHFTLQSMCENIIWNSRQMQADCDKYGIIYFDTSGNREEKIKQIMEEIEKGSIL